MYIKSKHLAIAYMCRHEIIQKNTNKIGKLSGKLKDVKLKNITIKLLLTKQLFDKHKNAENTEG